MNYTTSLHLKKPETTDAASIVDINDNMDAIDTYIGGYMDKIYPVGSIYMSTVSTSPATLFGVGTWERIKGRFLYGGEDSGITAGATGGQKSVSYTPAGSNSGGAVGNTTLTVEQIPSHNHTFTGSAVNTGNQSANHTHNYADYYANGTSGSTALTIDQIPGHSHNIWGPYSGMGGYSRGIPEGQNGGYNAGEQYSTVSAGGGKGHTHSVSNTSASRTTGNQSANHTHSVTAAGSIGNKGGGKAHNHGFTNPTFTGTAATIATMPPYLAVYVWKRTA